MTPRSCVSKCLYFVSNPLLFADVSLNK